MSAQSGPLGGGTGGDSTFSRIMSGDLPAKWVSNDPESPVVCFHNRLKWERVMLLVVTRMYMTQEKMWLDDVLRDALRLAVQVGEEHSPEGFRVLSNFGRGAHQSQLHAHIHVLSGLASNVETSTPQGEWRQDADFRVQRRNVHDVPHADLYRDVLSSSQHEFLTGAGAPSAARAAIAHAKSFSPTGFRLKANYSMAQNGPRGGQPGMFMLGGGQLALYV